MTKKTNVLNEAMTSLLWGVGYEIHNEIEAFIDKFGHDELVVEPGLLPFFQKILQGFAFGCRVVGVFTSPEEKEVGDGKKEFVCTNATVHVLCNEHEYSSHDEESDKVETEACLLQFLRAIAKGIDERGVALRIRLEVHGIGVSELTTHKGMKIT